MTVVDDIEVRSIESIKIVELLTLIEFEERFNSSLYHEKFLDLIKVYKGIVVRQFTIESKYVTKIIEGKTPITGRLYCEYMSSKILDNNRLSSIAMKLNVKKLYIGIPSKDRMEIIPHDFEYINKLKLFKIENDKIYKHATHPLSDRIYVYSLEDNEVTILED